MHWPESVSPYGHTWRRGPALRPHLRCDPPVLARTATPMLLLMLVAALLSYYFQDLILWLPSRI